MAIAFLYECRGHVGRGRTRWFHVQARPFHAAPFDGAANRDWLRFTVVDEHRGRVRLAVAADRIRDVAQRVESGELALDAALGDYEFGSP